MKKNKLLRIAILVTLLTGLYLFFHTGQLFVKQEPPAQPEIKTQPAKPPAITGAAPQKTVSSGASGENDTGKSGSMALSPVPHSEDTSPANTDYSYSIRREKKEMQILPGVTYAPSEGVSIKTASKDETIQLQRDHSYNTDYQVMWKKKY